MNIKTLQRNRELEGKEKEVAKMAIQQIMSEAFDAIRKNNPNAKVLVDDLEMEVATLIRSKDYMIKVLSAENLDYQKRIKELEDWKEEFERYADMVEREEV